jgi:hypothetical protein
MTTQLPLPKISPEQEVQNRLTVAYEAATPDDKLRVQTLIREAIGAEPSVRIILITPGMGAILFHDHNTQNREWKYALTLEYSRQMKNGDWDFTPNGIGFSPNGPMLDGQHRMAALALTTLSLPFAVALGVNLRAVEVIDTGARRMASAAVHILQHRDMPEARVKTELLQKSDHYLAKATSRPRQLLDTRAIGKALLAHEAQLNAAIEIGERVTHLIAKPTLKLREAQITAYMLLVSEWPASIVEAHLAHFQTGQDVGENSPFFVGAKILESEPKGERFSLSSKLGLTVKIFQLAEAGMKAVPRKNLKDAMESYPNPTYVPVTAA